MNHALFGKRDAKQCVVRLHFKKDAQHTKTKGLTRVAAARYGTTTLAEIEEMVTRVGKELGVEIICAQTDYEGEMCQLVSFRYLYVPWGMLFAPRSARFPSRWRATRPRR